MATNLPPCFSVQFLEQLLKLLVNVTLLKHVKSQRSYDILMTKELIFGFQILDLKDHFSASLIPRSGKVVLDLKTAHWTSVTIKPWSVFKDKLERVLNQIRFAVSLQITYR